jgi:hypothetical protein
MQVKQDHWNEFLEDISNVDVWIVNQYISSPSGDGGKTRILTLTSMRPLGSQDPPTEVITNKEKSKLLAKIIFLGKPETSSIPCNWTYLTNYWQAVRSQKSKSNAT